LSGHRPNGVSLVTMIGPGGSPPPTGPAGLGGGDKGTPEGDAALIDAVAVRIVNMGMTAPAVFFLESAKPLSFVGSQVLVFLEPFVKSVLNLASYDRFVVLLEDRKSIERLIVRIEDLDDEARRKQKERKKQEKLEKQQGKSVSRQQSEAAARMASAATGRPVRPRWRRWLGI